ncbi:MAG: hypothetical protein WBM90_03640 [Acidimicrobiia bacterium]
MTTVERRTRRNIPTNNAETERVTTRRFHWRGLILSLLLVISPVAAACTPAEIEASIQSISVSFEQGGAESGLARAIFVVNNAIPIINMRLSGAFGP